MWECRDGWMVTCVFLKRVLILLVTLWLPLQLIRYDLSLPIAFRDALS